MTTPAVLLHIGGEETHVTVRDAGKEDRVLPLTLGSQLTSVGYFRHSPPTPEEMETAIRVVEDEIIRIRQDIPHGAQLFSTDNDVRALARIAGIAENEAMTLSRDAVERTFDRLSLVINGRSAQFEGLPEGNDFAVTLLILREFMHHLDFDEIAVKGTKFKM